MTQTSRSIVAASTLVLMAYPSVALSQLAPAPAAPAQQMAPAPPEAAASSPAQPVQAATAASAPAGVAELDVVTIVSARRRLERLQDVPVAVTVLPQNTFDKGGAFNPADLAKLAPSVSISSSENDRDKLIFSIRGQGQSLETLFPGVIPYFSEVPLSKLSSGFFFDLESVQILRGPQGTLFGRNTDGGAVLITPKAPSNEREGYVTAILGNYNLHQSQGAFNLPIVSDQVQVRLAYDVARRNGFTRDLTNGVDLDNVHYNSFRGTIKLKPIDGLVNTTVLAVNNSDTNGGGTKVTFVDPAVLGMTLGFLGLPPATIAQNLAAITSEVANKNPRETSQSAKGIAQRRTDFVSNITSYQLSDDLLVKNVFGYVKQRELVGGDSDGSSLQLADLVSTRPTYNVRQITEELQLQGNSLSDRLKWIAGLYFDDSRPAGTAVQGDVIQALIFHSVKSADVFARSKAVFGQASYDLDSYVKGLTLTAGARKTWDRTSERATETTNGQCQPGLPIPSCTIDLGPKSSSAPTWTLSADYHLNNNTLLYVASRRGYKSGGFNVLFPTPDQASYGPEYLTDVEIGAKTAFKIAGMDAQLNGDVYRGKLKDVQRLTTSVANNQVFTVVANLPAAVVQGVELEGAIFPIKGLRLGVHYSYTDAKYTKVPDGFPIDRKFGYTPKHQGSLSASYRTALGSVGILSLGGDVYRQSSVELADYITSVPGHEPGYTTVNLNAGIEKVGGSNFDIGLFVTNVTNKVYRVGDFDFSNNLLGVVGSIYGPPRMFGGSVKWHF